MALTLELLNAAVVAIEQNPPLLIVSQASAQSLANSGFTALTWPSPGTDTYSGWSSGHPTRYTPTVSGVYLVTGSIGFAANATGGRVAQLCQNGVGNVINQVAGASAGSVFNSVVQVTSMITCNGTGDYFELYSDQLSGGALNSVAGVTTLTAFLIHR